MKALKEAWAGLTALIFTDPLVKWGLYMGIAISASIESIPAWVTVSLTAWKAVRSQHGSKQKGNESEQDKVNVSDAVGDGAHGGDGVRNTPAGS